MKRREVSMMSGAAKGLRRGAWRSLGPAGRCTMALGAAAALVFSFSSLGAKPPKPPPPPSASGVIYCNMFPDVYSMTPDGSNPQLVLSGLASAWNTKPTVHLHGGERWFLTFFPVGENSYPDGSPRVELFAIAPGGGAFQLSDDPTVQPDPASMVALQHQQWSLDDRRASWLGRRWGLDGGGNPVIVELGIFKVDLDTDVAQGPAPQAPVRVPMDYPARVEPDGQVWPEYNGFDWSPDDSRIAYASESGLFVADLSDPSANPAPVMQIAAECACWPDWSYDGSRIAFWVFAGGIDAIAPDGSGRVRICQYVSNRSGIYFYEMPHWSPDGRFLVVKKGRLLDYVDLYRVDVTKGSEVKITPRTGYGDPVDWVPEE